MFLRIAENSIDPIRVYVQELLTPPMGDGVEGVKKF